jgi:hypothetical protein
LLEHGHDRLLAVGLLLQQPQLFEIGELVAQSLRGRLQGRRRANRQA